MTQRVDTPPPPKPRLSRSAFRPSDQSKPGCLAGNRSIVLWYEDDVAPAAFVLALSAVALNVLMCRHIYSSFLQWSNLTKL